MIKVNKNNQKGITLIALIITIIVMLILVGVTINVALNGGLFDKAKTATGGTEKQAIYEQIVSNMEITDTGKISVKSTIDKVIAEFGTDKVTDIKPATMDENTTEVTFNIEGKNGTYNYKITTTSIEKTEETINGGNNEMYSFTLNGVTDAFVERDTNGYLHYNATKFWEVVGANLAGQYGMNPSNGQIIGPMSFDSDKLSTDLSSPPAVGDATFVFYESGEEVIIALIYAREDGDAAPTYITYERALEQFGGITIYFGEI